MTKINLNIVKAFFKSRGYTVTKNKFYLNGKDSYTLKNECSEIVVTKDELIEKYKLGTI